MTLSNRVAKSAEMGVLKVEQRKESGAKTTSLGCSRYESRVVAYALMLAVDVRTPRHSLCIFIQ